MSQTPVTVALAAYGSLPPEIQPMFVDHLADTGDHASMTEMAERTTLTAGAYDRLIDRCGKHLPTRKALAGNTQLGSDQLLRLLDGERRSEVLLIAAKRGELTRELAERLAERGTVAVDIVLVQSGKLTGATQQLVHQRLIEAYGAGRRTRPNSSDILAALRATSDPDGLLSLEACPPKVVSWFHWRHSFPDEIVHRFLSRAADVLASDQMPVCGQLTSRPEWVDGAIALLERYDGMLDPALTDRLLEVAVLPQDRQFKSDVGTATRFREAVLAHAGQVDVTEVLPDRAKATALATAYLEVAPQVGTRSRRALARRMWTHTDSGKRGRTLAFDTLTGGDVLDVGRTLADTGRHDRLVELLAAVAGREKHSGFPTEDMDAFSRHPAVRAAIAELSAYQRADLAEVLGTYGLVDADDLDHLLRSSYRARSAGPVLATDATDALGEDPAAWTNLFGLLADHHGTFDDLLLAAKTLT